MASISRNSIYLFSGSVVQKILAFIYFIFLARFLGPDALGKYTFAISFVSIFAILIDLGLNQLLIRESAKDEEKAGFYFHTTMALKLICSAIVYVVEIAAIKILPYPTITRELVYLAGIFMVLDNFSNTNYGILRGFIFWAGLFGTVFSYIDVVLLSRLAGDRAVGLYSAAGKIPAGLRMFPVAFVSALYPAATFYFVNNKPELRRILEESLFYLMLLTLPLIIGLWVLAQPAILILFGSKFLAATPSLRILTWSMLFVFLDYVFFTVLNACAQEKKNVSNRAIAMVLIAVLNLILIPGLKQIGSSIAFTLSFFALALMGAYWVSKSIEFDFGPLLRKSGQILVVAIIMGLIMFLLTPFFSWPIVAVVGLIIYVVGIWAVGLVRKSDLRYLKILTNFFIRFSTRTPRRNGKEE
ncbi:MAG: flippase [Candidatus Parcubacteria bacterium]|nr:flippase [Candidatus Parcubacteria bacterium]